MGKSAGGESDSISDRKTVLHFRNLSVELTSALLDACRANGVSVTNALTAAMALTSTDFVDGGVAKGGKERNYKVLQSLDMRRFGAKLDECDTVACMAGSNDLMLGPLRDRSGESVRLDPKSGDNQRLFWDMAREGRDQTKRFVESDGPVNAVRIFDFAMTISDMNNLVDLAARSKDSLGRAYSAGVANNGVYERQKSVRRENDKERGTIQSRGKYQVKEIYFGTPQSRSGCLYLVSTITVNGSMKLTFNAASPIVGEGTLAEFADAFIDLLEKVTKHATRNNTFSNLRIPEGSLILPATVLGELGIAIHWGAWSEFFSNIATMKENIQVRFGLPIVVTVEEPASSLMLSWILLLISSPPPPKESSRFLGCDQLLDILRRWSSHFATDSVDQRCAARKPGADGGGPRTRLVSRGQYFVHRCNGTVQGGASFYAVTPRGRA